MASRSTLSTPETRLLDKMLTRCGLKNDAALSRHLGVAAPVISKIRYNRLGISAAMMISIHEKCDISIAQIKQLLKAEA